jgi:hypothetical protein
MAPCVIIGERAAEILRAEHGLQIAMMAEKSRGAVLARRGRLPIQKGY